MLKNGTPASPAIAFASRVLPVPGGPHQQHALGNAPAQRLELLRLLQKLHDLLHLLLGLLDAGHVRERQLLLVLVQHLRAALAETHGPHVGGLELPHEDDVENAQDQNDRQQLPQHGAEHVAVVDQRASHLLVQQKLLKVFRRDQIHAEMLFGRAFLRAPQVGDAVGLAHQLDLLDKTLIDQPPEFELIHVLEFALGRIVKHPEYEQHQHADRQPRPPNPFRRQGARRRGPLLLAVGSVHHGWRFRQFGLIVFFVGHLIGYDTFS